MKWYGYMFILVIVVAMVFSPKEGDIMPIRKDLIRTLEDLGMVNEDIQKWDVWISKIDSVTSKFSGGDVLKIARLEADMILSTGMHAGARVSRTSNQTIAGGQDNVEWDTEDRDTHGYVDLVADNEHITIPAGMGGYYMVGGQITFTLRDGGSGDYISIIGHNGVTNYNACETEVQDQNRTTMSGFLHLSAGDTLFLQVYNNGANIAVTGDGEQVQSYMYLYLLIPSFGSQGAP